MDNTVPAPGAGWTITGQIYKVAPGPSGALTSGMEVSFLTGTGIMGTVFLPMTQYSVAAARGAVAAQALIMDQVQNLKG